MRVLETFHEHVNHGNCGHTWLLVQVHMYQQCHLRLYMQSHSEKSQGIYKEHKTKQYWTRLLELYSFHGFIRKSCKLQNVPVNQDFFVSFKIYPDSTQRPKGDLFSLQKELTNTQKETHHNLFAVSFIITISINFICILSVAFVYNRSAVL